MKKTEILTAAFLVIVYCVVSPGLAVPAKGGIHLLEQNDGSQFTATLWGDEWSHGWETSDGYSIVFNETTKDWMYAVPNSEGLLVPSVKRVGKDSPQQTLSKHARPTGKARVQIDSQKASVLPEAPANAPPVTGTSNIPVILVNFKDTSATYNAASFTSLLFGSGTKSMKDYYEEVSYGTFSVSPGPGGIAGWYTASQNHDYYGENEAVGGDMWPGTLVREAVGKADPTFNFAPYDKDSDCYVDAVNIIHQGSGEEVEGSPSTDIWSHSWNLNSAYNYGNSNGGEYTTNDACPTGGFIKVNEYVIQPETQSGGQVTIGVFAHEYGHVLGLPDLYDTTYASRGIGEWSLMAHGLWNGISKGGDTPAHLDAWSRSLLGWVSPTIVIRSGVTQIKRVEDTSVVYQMLDNQGGVGDWTRSGIGRGEYFLVENRQKTGFDAALPGEGLLIWHIDESVGGNFDKTHKLVDLEEADGLNHLDVYGSNAGDAFDPWYATVSGFTQSSTPNSRLYIGSDSGVRITNIGDSASTMTVNLVVPQATPWVYDWDSCMPDYTYLENDFKKPNPSYPNLDNCPYIWDIYHSECIPSSWDYFVTGDSESYCLASPPSSVAPYLINDHLWMSGAFYYKMKNYPWINEKTCYEERSWGCEATTEEYMELRQCMAPVPSNFRSCGPRCYDPEYYECCAGDHLIIKDRDGDGIQDRKCCIEGKSINDVWNPFTQTFFHAEVVEYAGTGWGADILNDPQNCGGCGYKCTASSLGACTNIAQDISYVCSGSTSLCGNGICIAPAPLKAEFTTNVTSGQPPLPVNFTDISTGNPKMWNWSLGDGSWINTTIANQKNSTHTYGATGTYTVKLTVCNITACDTTNPGTIITVIDTVTPLPGYTNPPTDPDSDSYYEDLNANGFADWDDAVVLFWNTDWIQENEPVSAFDFNHNGFIDWDDAVVLFWEV